jgi:hypothetical protein
MRDLSLHILDIIENSVNAGAKNISLLIDEDIGKNLLKVQIKDDGKGMGNKMLKNVTDPFTTTRTTRKVGLGLSLIKQAAEIAGGNLKINSKKGKGTDVIATFKYDHIDRKPLGDIMETLISAILMSPDVEYKFKHRKNNKVFEFDTIKIKKSLCVAQLIDIKILNSLKKVFNNKFIEV